MTRDFERLQTSLECERLFEWRKWKDEIPYLHFPKNVDAKALPPFGGTIIRYWIKPHAAPTDDIHVSVYLDCYDMAGCFGEPYWEICPSADGNTERFAMNNTHDLMVSIKESLRVQKELAGE